MIQWVYENAVRCPALTKVVVATDSEAIAEVIHRIGGETCMTDPSLPTGSDRVAAVAQHYPYMDVVINLQGDEPFIKPFMLEQLIAPYAAGETPEMTTLAYALDRETEHKTPSIVKVITDQRGNALYFSRAPIPYFRESVERAIPVYHHMGLYAFRQDFLTVYTTLPQTPLEKVESLEQLRALEHGYTIRVCLTDTRTLEINTPEEYAHAQALMAQEEV